MISVFTDTKRIHISSELIILFGLLTDLPTEPVHWYNCKGESRYQGIIEWCKENINITHDPSNADVFILPYKFKDTDDPLYKSLSALAKTYSKKLLCFYNDDNDSKYDITNETLLYRTSFYKSTKLPNELPLIAFSPDYFDGNIIDTPTLTIGYCGHTMHGRLPYLHSLQNSRLHTDFIIRSGFWWEPGVDKQTARLEYFNNIRNNIFTFCYRGAGNFSYRFYETLMMGRIPILVNTDCVFPNEDVLNENVGIFINESDLKSPDDLSYKIEEYYETYKDSLINIQRNNRKLWETYYSPIGFLQSLVSTL